MTGNRSDGGEVCTWKYPPKIGVVVHFFYIEQAEKIARLLKHIPCEFDLYATAPEGKSEAIRALLSDFFPGKKVLLKRVPNRGFDIAPFVYDFKDCYPGYDLVLKLHTKKSPHVPWLKGWGDYLLGNMAGSSEIVSAILTMFAEDKKLGLVYPEIVPPLKEELKKDQWQENWDICRDLSSRLGLSIQREMMADFPAGSMFWFRPKALEPLFQLGLAPEDFPEGMRIRRNGTLAHAVERLLVLIAEKRGFTGRAVCFEPFKKIRNMSFWGRLHDKTYCEWNRFLDLVGFKR